MYRGECSRCTGLIALLYRDARGRFVSLHTTVRMAARKAPPAAPDCVRRAARPLLTAAHFRNRLGRPGRRPTLLPSAHIADPIGRGRMGLKRLKIGKVVPAARSWLETEMATEPFKLFDDRSPRGDGPNEGFSRFNLGPLTHELPMIHFPLTIRQGETPADSQASVASSTLARCTMSPWVECLSQSP